MSHTVCRRGLFALRTIGLQAELDESLDISFYDPIELSADLCKLQNRYAYQGFCKFQGDLGGGPTLYVDGKSMGTLRNLKVQELKVLAEPSPFGRGTKTIYDENVRKALEIKGSRINLEFQCPYEVQKMAPLGRRLTAKLYKLAIYEKDGFFSEHADTLHGDDHIGTLVVCLPLPHEGGTFILTDDGNQLKLRFDELIKDEKIPWVAFYTDVKHQVEVVKSGTRMTLQFDLIIGEKGPEEEDERAMWKYNERKHNLSKMLEDDNKYTKAPAEYRFQDWNLEILDSIRNKLNIVLNREKEKEESKTSKEEDSVPSSPMQKRDRPDKDKPLKAKKTKEQKRIEAFFYGLEESSDDEFSDLDVPVEPEHLDCVAILLKRRYGATTLSFDTLRGSDSVLYHALKDHFRVEVKKIILEQSSDYEGGFKDQPIEIVALSDVKEQVDSCSSEDELELGPDDKYIPKKRGTNVSKPGGKNKGTKSNTNKKSEEELKVCLVSGFSPKSLLTLVNQDYIEHMGNDAQAASHAYMHAALFVYTR